MELTYNPDVFAVADLDAAKRIILTAEGDQTTEWRWAHETPYLAGLLGEQLGLGPGQLVIDYGCGIGRLAKALIERFGCAVLGVDISQEMRCLAPDYVGSAAFSVVSRRILLSLATQGLRADAAISVWVLQHCHKPAEDIELLASSLRPGARLGVVNLRGRAVPTRERGWANDRLDILAMLRAQFEEGAAGDLDPAVVGEDVARPSLWATFRKP